jgi:DNA-binding NarL/FixJ family response regulator
VNKAEVVDVLSALASGTDPISGEAFEEVSPYNHPQVIRALFGSLELIQTPVDKRPKKSQEEINREEGRPLRFNMRWSDEEDKELIGLIEQGTLTGEIAEQLQRTKGSIYSRLQRQGLLEREELLNRSDEEIAEIVQARLVSRAEKAPLS